MPFREEVPLERVLMCACYLQFWTASLRKRRNPASQNRRASDARVVAGRLARKTNGFASVVIRGTRSTLAGSAPLASINGLTPNAYHAANGRRIRIGIRRDSCYLRDFTS